MASSCTAPTAMSSPSSSRPRSTCAPTNGAARLENRERLVREIIDGVRARCRPDFNLGIRLSGERFGIQISEALSFAQDLMRGGQLDYIDMSLWDVFKEPEDEAYKGRSLTDWFAGLERGSTRLGVAGQVRTAESAVAALEAGVDFVLVGRAAILHHDFPEKVRRDPAFQPTPLPVTAATTSTMRG